MQANGSNWENLRTLDEAAEHYEREYRKAESHKQLKEQLARIRAALEKLDEVCK